MYVESISFWGFPCVTLAFKKSCQKVVFANKMQLMSTVQQKIVWRRIKQINIEKLQFYNLFNGMFCLGCRTWLRSVEDEF